MLNQSSEYALRAVVDLARSSTKPRSAGQIAETTKVPLPYLQKVLRMLRKAGILSAQRGIGGGFRLARDPADISILDVLTAADAAPQRIERCPLGIPGHTQLCALHALLDHQVANAESVFATTSIRDIFEAQSDITPLCDNLATKRSSPPAATPCPDGAGGARCSDCHQKGS